MLGPGLWTALPFHHHSIPRPMDRVVRIPLLSARRPARPARLPAFPRAVVLILIVGIAQAAALVLHWAPPTPAQGQQRRIPTHPLRPTRRFDQRRWGIATAATRVASSRVGCQAVGWHALAL